MNNQIQLPKTFNYLGSKIKLLPFLHENIEKYTNKKLKDINGFADLFCGTGVVTYFLLASGCNYVISNDIQYYSWIVSSVWLNNNIDSIKIKNFITNINNNNNKLNENDIKDSKDNFILNNYTPYNENNRTFFTKLNGFKIDITRQFIENQFINKSLTNEEYRLLLKILLYSVINISNTAGVYESYLKKFKNSSLKSLELKTDFLDILINSNAKHLSYNDDVFHFLQNNNLKDIECCYIDSPYNSRKYSTNFHLLETISKYDSPKIKGKIGIREDASCTNSKKFCLKSTVIESFQDILSKINSKYIFISYNNESLISKDKLIELLNLTKWNNIKCIEKEYSRFKSNKNGNQNKKVIEYLFCATKLK